VPVLAAIGSWGRRHLPVSEELGVRAALLEKGGAPLWDAFMAELRETHLGVPPRGSLEATSVAGMLRESYEAVLAKRSKR
jgi:hypothetical protein